MVEKIYPQFTDNGNCSPCSQPTVSITNDNNFMLPFYVNVQVNHNDSTYKRIRNTFLSSQYGIMFICMSVLTYLILLGYIISYYLYPDIIEHPAYVVIMIFIGFIAHMLLTLLLYIISFFLRSIKLIDC